LLAAACLPASCVGLETKEVKKQTKEE